MTDNDFEYVMVFDNGMYKHADPDDEGYAKPRLGTALINLGLRNRVKIVRNSANRYAVYVQKLSGNELDRVYEESIPFLTFGSI